MCISVVHSFFCWVLFHGMDISLFIKPFTHCRVIYWKTFRFANLGCYKWSCYKHLCDNHYVCVCVSPVRKSTIVLLRTGVQLFACIFSIWRNWKLFLIVAIHIHNNVGVIHLFYILSSYLVCSVFHLSHSNRNVVISHIILICFFPADCWCWASSNVLFAFCPPLFCEMSVHFLIALFHHLLFFF